jgi:transposase InsO family protein
MKTLLHKNMTSPVICHRISGCDDPASVLARRNGVGGESARKWKYRDSVQDRCSTPHRPKMTLPPAQEASVVELRHLLLLPLNDLLALMREFRNRNVSRSGLDCCLRRYGAGNLKVLLPEVFTESSKTFKTHEHGFPQVDVKHLHQTADETTRRYLFVVIDLATRWVFVRIMPVKTAANARKFPRNVQWVCPISLLNILIGNGNELIDRIIYTREIAASGSHGFDQVRTKLGIEHRPTRPKLPQTNGMIEYFSGRIADVLKTDYFDSARYNMQLPQHSAVGSRTPILTMKNCYEPDLLAKSAPSVAESESYLNRSRICII